MREIILTKVDTGIALNPNDLRYLLMLENEDDIQQLYKKAYQIKLKNVGKKVYFRGIIEFSNICEKDCFYCGIRKSNHKVKRFMLKEEEIREGARWAFESGYGSMVLQSGERSDAKFVAFIENILKKVKSETDGRLGITLSLGEQTRETYQRWFDAGAHRYLLRIESTNPELYHKLHPADHDFEYRKNCLSLLREVGYQVGTGVMIGLPGQSINDLVNDILFFKANDIDMIGMGPYIPHADTPLSNNFPDFQFGAERQLQLGLKMIAVTRLFLQDVNIAATTALQALNPTGREMGLMAGANIIMPNVTETKYRSSYQLYDNKPCLNENSTQCRGCLELRIEGIGEFIGLNEWGDSPHFFNRLRMG